ncbi:unnamed protein product [Cercospora beticola]|nr:unnamed protein product [Cercospora beticola]
MMRICPSRIATPDDQLLPGLRVQTSSAFARLRVIVPVIFKNQSFRSYLIRMTSCCSGVVEAKGALEALSSSLLGGSTEVLQDGVDFGETPICSAVSNSLSSSLSSSSSPSLPLAA